MPYARKVDRNHVEIVATLRWMGCSVESLAGVGKGVPDLLVASQALPWPHTVLLEVKDGRKKPSARTLTPAQVRWRETWRGVVQTVTGVDDAIAWYHKAVRGG